MNKKTIINTAAPSHEQATPTSSITTETISLERNTCQNTPYPKNAISHGLYSNAVVLPWESAEDYQELQRAYRDDLKPHGVIQEEIVDEIVCLVWKKRRFVRGYNLLFSTDLVAQQLAAAAEVDGWTGVERYVRKRRDSASNVEQAVMVSPAEFRARVKARLASGDFHGPPSPVVKPVVSDQQILERLYQPAELDRFLTTLGSLNARIDKALARLVISKEFKLRYGKKMQEE